MEENEIDFEEKPKRGRKPRNLFGEKKRSLKQVIDKNIDSLQVMKPTEIHVGKAEHEAIEKEIENGNYRGLSVVPTINRDNHLTIR